MRDKDLSIIPDQARFLLELARRPDVGWLSPEVLDYVSSLINGRITCYWMPRYQAQNLRSVLLADTVLAREIPSIAKSAIELALWADKCLLFDPTATPLRSGERDAYADRFLDGKFRQRLQKSLEMIRIARSFDALEELRRATLALLRASEINIGGRQMLAPGEIISKALSDPGIREMLFPSRVGTIHGDLHNQNLLVVSEHRRLVFMKLIDPRGFRYGADFAYDASKAAHAVVGYDFIQEGMIALPFDCVEFPGGCFSVHASWSTIETRSEQGRGGSSDLGAMLVENATERKLEAYGAIRKWLMEWYLPKLLADDPTWRVRVAFHTAMHFLTMIPHHVGDQPRVLWLLYLRGIELMNEFWTLVHPGSGAH